MLYGKLECEPYFFSSRLARISHRFSTATADEATLTRLLSPFDLDVTRDSYRAQHAPMKYFGLGSDSAVESVEIRWPDRTTEVMRDPANNTYHVVSSSTARSGHVAIVDDGEGTSSAKRGQG